MATRRLPQTTPTKTDGRPQLRPKISTHLMLVSPKTAREMAAEAFEHQRPLNTAHVHELQLLIETGELRPGTTVTFAVRGTQRYLVNGQHTLAALGQTTGGPLWLQIEAYRVDHDADVGYLYQTYDRNRPRSWGDLYQADPELATLDLSRTAIRELAGAMTWLLFGFTRAHPQAQLERLVALGKSVRMRRALMVDWHDELCDALNGCRGPSSITKLLHRAAVWATILVTYRGPTRDLAHQFWPRVARDSGLVAGDPAHTLLRWLRETPARNMQPDVYARYVAAAWNAAYEYRDYHKIQPLKTTQPFLLAGTPFDGTVGKHYVTPTGDILHTPAPWEAGV